MGDQRHGLKADRPSEWQSRLVVLTSGLLAFETPTGLAIQ